MLNWWMTLGRHGIRNLLHDLLVWDLLSIQGASDSPSTIAFCRRPLVSAVVPDPRVFPIDASSFVWKTWA